MKDARPIKDEASAPGTGAHIVAAGDYPSKYATVMLILRLCAYARGWLRAQVAGVSGYVPRFALHLTLGRSITAVAARRSAVTTTATA